MTTTTLNRAEMERLAAFIAEFNANKGPGKFEGEGAETAYYYEESMDGCAEVIDQCEGEGGGVYLIPVTAEERAAFNLGDDVTTFAIEEDSNGFAYGTPLSDAAAESLRAEFNSGEDDDSDE